MFLPSFQDIFETFQSNCKVSRLCHFESRKKCLDDASFDQSLELMEIGTSCAVAYSPHSLLFDLVIIIKEDLDEFVDNAYFKALLDLRAGSCSNVREGPADLLPDGLLFIIDQVVKSIESTSFND